MLVKVLASGSKGNTTLVSCRNLNFLIDCGISKKRIVNALAKIDYNLDDINYIFLTHEHSDHIKGLDMVIKNTNIEIYLTKGTLKGILNNSAHECVKKIYIENPNRFHILEKINEVYETIDLKGVKFTPLMTFHDTLEPVGFLIEEDNKSLGYITDTGYVHQDVLNKIKNCDCYIFETNHDPEMLMNSNRTYNLKMRILSDRGHLSNADGIYALANAVGPKTKYVIFAHISEECNLREIINLTRKRIFSKLGIDDTKINFIMSLETDIEEIEL